MGKGEIGIFDMENIKVLILVPHGKKPIFVFAMAFTHLAFEYNLPKGDFRDSQ